MSSLEEFLGRTSCRVYIGTSGWDYDDWVGPFYDTDRSMFSHYARIFNTAEVNSSFYALMNERFFESLARAAPPNFIFSVKMYRGITHKKLLNPKHAEAEMEAYFKSIQPLARHGKLGAVLIQMPPRARGEIPWFADFLDSLPKGFRYAVEFRDPSWLSEESFKELEDRGIAYVIVDEPLLPPLVKVTSDLAYVRWHGRGERPWYYYHYTLEELREWAERLKEVLDEATMLLGYFNNHFRGFAPHNALQMLVLLGLANTRQREALASIEKRLSSMPRVGASVLHALSEGEVGEVLKVLAGERRFQRALEISDSEVSYQVGDRGVSAKVKAYRVEIDKVEKRIFHDCEDWRKLAESRRFCKHLVKLFLALPREIAVNLLSDIVSNLEDWSFEG